MLEHTHNKKYCDVLLIVSGGTLTMVNTDHGYVAAPGLADRLKTHSSLYDAQHAKEIDLDDDTLVTPPTMYKSRIRYKVCEFEHLIDSSNILIED